MADDDDNDDRHDRENGPSGLGALFGRVQEFEPPTLGYSEEWWERRDRDVAEQRALAAVEQERARMKKRAGELVDHGGFPELFVTAAQRELRETEAMRFARMFVHLPRKILVLAGGVGAGKTTAAAWIGLKSEDPNPAFVRVNELERRGRYDQKLDDWLRDKTSLVIDDVGAEYLDGKGAFRSLMDEVVDTFYSRRRVLIMTTNLRPRRKGEDEQEQFLERYGERVWSRLNQLGVWGDCGTKDLRKEQQS
jgi:DNA replication protein DnaC